MTQYTTWELARFLDLSHSKSRSFARRPDDLYTRSSRSVGALVLLAAVAAVLLLTLAASAGRAATVEQSVCRVFGPRCTQALKVARCESKLRPRAVGPNGERGLFQVHPVHFAWANPRRLFEPVYNARVAYRLSRGGRDWSDWACRP
jgi:hypothetical protein